MNLSLPPLPHPVSSPRSVQLLRLEGSNHTKAYYNCVAFCKVGICNFKAEGKGIVMIVIYNT